MKRPIPIAAAGRPQHTAPAELIQKTTTAAPFASAPGSNPDTPRASGTTARDRWAGARTHHKALRAEVRRFTKRSRRRRLAWLLTISAVAFVAISAVVTAFSPLSAVGKITVVGAHDLEATTVEASLNGLIGQPIGLIDENEVKAALSEFATIETYALEAHPPHEVVVRIVERVPIGYITSTSGYSEVDAAGVVLSNSETPPADQPRLELGPDKDTALTAVGKIVRSLPASIRSRLRRSRHRQQTT